MTSNQAKALVMSAVLGAMGFFGIGSTKAEAQHRGFHGGGVIVRPSWGCRSFWGRRWGLYDPFCVPTVAVVDPIAQAKESGYSDGHSRGKDDARHVKANAPESHKDFSNSDSQTYRQAFLQGYADGYREKTAE